MSLINQMLKDLDKRTSGTSGGAHPIFGVAATTAPCRPRRMLWAGLALTLLVAGGAVWWVRSVEPSPPERAVDRVATEPSAAALAADGPALPALPVRMEPVVVDAEDHPAMLENLRLMQDGERLRVEVDFSGLPAYRLHRMQQGRQLALEWPEGAMAAPLPDTVASPLLQKVAYEKENGSARLLFNLREACRYTELSVEGEPGGKARTLRFAVEPEPSVAFATALGPSSPEMPPIPEPVADQPAVRPEALPAKAAGPVGQALVRQEVQPTPRERAAKLCRDGLESLRQGQLRQAESALRAALAIEPGHIQARDGLLHLLARQNRQSEIRILLEGGIREVPGHRPYRVRLARLLIEEGNLSRAREELTREPRPEVAEATDLYAMLATVQQRQGQYEEAAGTYRQLLAVRPEQAVWWMGLGIALEGISSTDQAGQAYRQALSRGGLSEGLQTYIRQRLAVLGNPGRTPGAATQAGRERS